MLHRLIPVFASGLVVVPSLGQIVWPASTINDPQVAGSFVYYGETTLAASQRNPNEVVATFRAFGLDPKFAIALGLEPFWRGHHHAARRFGAPHVLYRRRR